MLFKMAIAKGSSELPNLKIEIENDLDETIGMDDDNIKNKVSTEDGPEEGELSDSKDTDVEVKPSVFELPLSTSNDPTWDREKRYENKGGAFMTGVNIFSKEEQIKLGERAKRFGLDPSDARPVTEQQITELYKSLGMKDEVTEKNFRLNALHVRGTENMSTQDIFNYFKDYGPASIEWINDYSCNVVWIDNLSAARAMIGLSKHVEGLEEFHSKANPFLKEREKESDKENEKEEVVVVQEIEEPDGDDIIMVMERSRPVCTEANEFTEETQMDVDSDVVHASDIPIPIPPGKWRKGTSHPKAKCILLRFSTRTDKKRPQAEKMSEYYKRYGNPNYGGIKGLITSSRKRRYQWHEHKVFEDDRGDERDFIEGYSDGKNPWGNLAKSWSNLDKHRTGRNPGLYDTRTSLQPRSFPITQPSLDEQQGRSVLHRTGTVAAAAAAPAHQSDSDDASLSNASDESQWTKRSKLPRMRMYADEEEVRIERRKAQVKVQSRRNIDRDMKKYHENNSRFEDERKQRRDSKSSAHQERSRSQANNKNINQQKSETFESSKRDSASKNHDDLRSRLDRDGKSKTSRGVNVATSTVWDRLKHHHAGDGLDWEQETSDSESDENGLEDSCADLRDSVLQGKKTNSRFEGGDLRSKLNLKKNMRQHAPIQKSPLRIEIDNDEYYRLIGSDQE